MNKENIDNPPMTLTEVCEYSGFSPRTIQAEARIGNLKYYDRNGNSRFRRYYREDIDRWIKHGSSFSEAS